MKNTGRILDRNNIENTFKAQYPAGTISFSGYGGYNVKIQFSANGKTYNYSIFGIADKLGI